MIKWSIALRYQRFHTPFHGLGSFFHREHVKSTSIVISAIIDMYLHPPLARLESNFGVSSMSPKTPSAK